MTEKTFPAVKDRLDEVLIMMDDLIEPYGASGRTKVQLHVCVEELFVNVCNYAYVPSKGDVTVMMDVREPEGDEENAVFIMKIKDKGVPFNPLEHADPDVTLAFEERKVGGLGIFMVKKRMDKFEYEYTDGYNISTIEKILK